MLRSEGSSSVSAYTPALGQPNKSSTLCYLLSSHSFSLFPFCRYTPTPPPPPTHPPSLFAVRCGGCAEAISPAELVMRAGSAVFHLRCFTCRVCSCRLQTGDRCVLREGQLLCAREDFHRCAASQSSSDTGTGLFCVRVFVHVHQSLVCYDAMQYWVGKNKDRGCLDPVSWWSFL